MPDPTLRADARRMTREAQTRREFRIWVEGRLSDGFADGFVGVDQHEEAGTVLSGDYVDDAHLQGLLERLRSLGIAVRRFEINE